MELHPCHFLTEEGIEPMPSIVVTQNPRTIDYILSLQAARPENMFSFECYIASATVDAILECMDQRNSNALSTSNCPLLLTYQFLEYMMLLVIL